MALPNFIIIGAAKAGTSSIYYYLKQHPDIFMSPIKETNFFAFEGQPPLFKTLESGPTSINNRTITTLESYENQFVGGVGKKAIGEASPLYLYMHQAAVGIHRRIPKARLITILRNPVDRAYSAYLQLRRDGYESEKTFEKALEKEEDRIRENWAPSYRYCDLGRYSRSLTTYLDIFGSDVCRIYLFDELKINPKRLVADIGFLLFNLCHP